MVSHDEELGFTRVLHAHEGDGFVNFVRHQGRVARANGLQVSDVLREGGIQVRTPAEVYVQEKLDSAFALLVMDERLRPAGMDEKWLLSLSPLHKQQWVEFAQKLEAVVTEGGPMLDSLLASLGAESVTTAPKDWIGDHTEVEEDQP